MEERICHFCGRNITEEETVTFDGVIMCESCFEDNTGTCDHCEETVWRHDSVSDDTIFVCECCYNEHYTRCTCCGRIIDYENNMEVNDEYYCDSCYQSILSMPIHSYNYKPTPVFYGKDDLYMGVELEIDNGGEFDENAQAVCDVANKCHDHIYCKHDGSINDGFEIVSHPMTLDYHKNEMPWKKVLEKALEMDYRSHQTSTCGLHIHVNRNYFGSDYEECDAAIGRAVYFVEKHWDELLKFSRRTEASINRWASRYGIAATAKDTYENAKKQYTGRYVAVNLLNEYTVEFRMFRGTLRYESFMAALELISEICKVCKNMDDSMIERLTWCDFVGGIPEDKKHLIEYLKSKRLYVNEFCNDTEEE